jgi:hypothetical protein
MSTLVPRIRYADFSGSMGPYSVRSLTTRLLPGRCRSRWTSWVSNVTLDFSLSQLQASVGLSSDFQLTPWHRR